MVAAKTAGPELPENLLNQVDSITENEKTALQAEMIKGYQEMAELNLQIAEEFFAAENDIPGGESAE